MYMLLGRFTIDKFDQFLLLLIVEFAEIQHYQDGTWDTVKRSCVVRDFADICIHSYPVYLKEVRESTSSNELQTLSRQGPFLETTCIPIVARLKRSGKLEKEWQTRKSHQAANEILVLRCKNVGLHSNASVNRY
ncbi:uncharacterized protein [Spinacia oleracea]|uniref:Uncharacterized protein isoform X1 n=1 Tax=Spinacia oleracea TaxID=3562 RepID=A0ABM3R611_SPIOL|nr:uncharacterized protein LOC110804052 isoform X1 [Spinacia oleracea]XP_056691054.1 uncharacterized protein LOC110804052 isoform X1 [Spinacia oleracea]